MVNNSFLLIQKLQQLSQICIFTLTESYGLRESIFKILIEVQIHKRDD